MSDLEHPLEPIRIHRDDLAVLVAAVLLSDTRRALEKEPGSGYPAHQDTVAQYALETADHLIRFQRGPQK